MSKQSDITLLLMVLILLSASIGFLHGRKKVIDPTVVADDSARIILADQDAIDYLQPYLISGNMESAAATLHQFIEPILFATLERLLDNKSVTLTPSQQVELIGGLLQYDHTAAKQNKIVALLYKRFADFPVLVPLVQNYPKVIAPVIEWAHSSDVSQARVVRDGWFVQSVQKAISLDDPDLLVSLYQAGVRPSHKEVNELAVQVVKEKKSPKFIPILIDQFGADITYSPDGKRSLLMLAVETNNKAMVQVLIKKGANPARLLDSQVGTARQIAFERGYAPIELLLEKKK